jgi:hypothetical protein
MEPAATSPMSSIRSLSTRFCGTSAATTVTEPPRPFSDAQASVETGGGGGGGGVPPPPPGGGAAAAVEKLKPDENALARFFERARTRQK